jgi:peptidoglycan/LPS O-acetylase OafA/YrhL
MAYFNLYTFSRIDGICIGSGLALFRQFNVHFLTRHVGIVVLTLAGLNFLFYFFNSSYNFSFPFLAIVGYTTFAVIFGILVNEAINNNKVVALFFDNPPMKFFGKISYGFYIFHWPIYLILLKIFARIPNIAVSLISTAIAILVSWVSFNFFESKILRFKKRFRYASIKNEKLI